MGRYGRGILPGVSPGPGTWRGRSWIRGWSGITLGIRTKGNIPLSLQLPATQCTDNYPLLSATGVSQGAQLGPSGIGVSATVVVENNPAIVRLFFYQDASLGIGGGVELSDEYVVPPGPQMWAGAIGFQAKNAIPGQTATIAGYVNEKGEPQAGTPPYTPTVAGPTAQVSIFTQTALVLSGPGVTSFPAFTVPPQYNALYLAVFGTTGNMDIDVISKPVSLAATGIESFETYGVTSVANALYAVPLFGNRVSLQVHTGAPTTATIQAIPTTLPIPQFDPVANDSLVSVTSANIGGGGVDTYVLPAYDGDALLHFYNASGASVTLFGVSLFAQTGATLAIWYSQFVPANTIFNLPVKLPHRINIMQVSGAAGSNYALTLQQTPRRGGS